MNDESQLRHRNIQDRYIDPGSTAKLVHVVFYRPTLAQWRNVITLDARNIDLMIIENLANINTVCLLVQYHAA